MKLFLSCSLILSFSIGQMAHALDAQKAQKAESKEGRKNKFVEVREWLKDQHQSKTCADEYFTRRKRVGVKLGIAPAIIMLGGIRFQSIKRRTESSIEFFRNQRTLKLIHESHTGGGKTIDKFYANLIKKNPDLSISKELFIKELASLDESGKLCDGSLVDKKRARGKGKLKNRLAYLYDIKDYFRKIDIFTKSNAARNAENPLLVKPLEVTPTIGEHSDEKSNDNREEINDDKEENEEERSDNNDESSDDESSDDESGKSSSSAQ